VVIEERMLRSGHHPLCTRCGIDGRERLELASESEELAIGRDVDRRAPEKLVCDPLML
jgi:hypothetical protein